MNDYIPTIEELLGKRARELSAIFRKASNIASDRNRPTQDRVAAAKTVENVRRCVPRSPKL